MWGPTLILRAQGKGVVSMPHGVGAESFRFSPGWEASSLGASFHQGVVEAKRKSLDSLLGGEGFCFWLPATSSPTAWPLGPEP